MFPAAEVPFEASLQGTSHPAARIQIVALRTGIDVDEPFTAWLSLSRTQPADEKQKLAFCFSLKTQQGEQAKRHQYFLFLYVRLLPQEAQEVRNRRGASLSRDRIILVMILC